MDGMHFAQSMKLVVRMCEQLKVPALATKVLKYLQDKETKDMFTQQMEKNRKGWHHFDQPTRQTRSCARSRLQPQEQTIY